MAEPPCFPNVGELVRLRQTVPSSPSLRLNTGIQIELLIDAFEKFHQLEAFVIVQTLAASWKHIQERDK
jgi:hypothetical protein